MQPNAYAHQQPLQMQSPYASNNLGGSGVPTPPFHGATINSHNYQSAYEPQMPTMPTMAPMLQMVEYDPAQLTNRVCTDHIGCHGKHFMYQSGLEPMRLIQPNKTAIILNGIYNGLKILILNAQSVLTQKGFPKMAIATHLKKEGFATNIYCDVSIGCQQLLKGPQFVPLHYIQHLKHFPNLNVFVPLSANEQEVKLAFVDIFANVVDAQDINLGLNCLYAFAVSDWATSKQQLEMTLVTLQKLRLFVKFYYDICEAMKCFIPIFCTKSPKVEFFKNVDFPKMFTDYLNSIKLRSPFNEVEKTKKIELATTNNQVVTVTIPNEPTDSLLYHRLAAKDATDKFPKATQEKIATLSSSQEGYVKLMHFLDDIIEAMGHKYAEIAGLSNVEWGHGQLMGLGLSSRLFVEMTTLLVTLYQNGVLDADTIKQFRPLIQLPEVLPKATARMSKMDKILSKGEKLDDKTTIEEEDFW